MIRLGNSSLLDFCSPSMRGDQYFAAAAQALDPFLADIRSKIALNVVITNLAAQPENILDFLAVYHFNVDYYDATLPYATKLRIVQNVILSKSQKGTAGIIKQQLSIAFSYAEVIEWWQENPPAPHDTFRILITDPLVDPAKVAQMVRIIMAFKNVRSYFAGISSFTTLPGSLTIYGSLGSYAYTVLR